MQNESVRDDGRLERRLECVFSPLVSGLGSPAGAHCTVPPADRDAWPESPPAADRNTHTHTQTIKESYEAFHDPQTR